MNNLMFDEEIILFQSERTESELLNGGYQVPGVHGRDFYPDIDIVGIPGMSVEAQRVSADNEIFNAVVGE